MKPEKMPEAVAQWWPHFVEAGKRYGMDAYLLAAIAWRESRGGEALTPPGPTGKGDPEYGHYFGYGIMQVDERSHGDWLGLADAEGVPLWQDARQNILKGAEILHACKLSFPREEGLAVIAYNCGVGRVHAALGKLPHDATPGQRFAAADVHTTGGDYGASVLAHRVAFASAGVG